MSIEFRFIFDSSVWTDFNRVFGYVTYNILLKQVVTYDIKGEINEYRTDIGITRRN